MHTRLGIIGLVLLLVVVGCSQPRHVPRAPAPSASQVGVLPPSPKALPLSLSVGKLYQCTTPVDLARDGGGPTAQTIPANGYFRVASVRPDGWYSVGVSDGNSDWTMWLDGSALTASDVHEVAEPGSMPAAINRVDTQPQQVAPPTRYSQEPAYSGQTSGGEGEVYITKSGKKYHRAGCSYLSNSQIPISLADAESRGYTPCSRCRP